MADTDLVQDEQQPLQEQPKEQQPETDPYIDKALELGWRPQEDWDGAPEEFIDAKEFVRRQPLFDKISGLSRQVKQLDEALKAFKVHHNKVKETEYNRAFEQIKQAHRRALAEGETEQALALADKMDEIATQKEEFEQEAQQQFKNAPQAPDPTFTKWVSENNWYQKDRAMTAYADKLGVELHQQGYPNDEVLRMVTKEVRTEFKHKFTNPKREQPSAVEAGGRKPDKSGSKLDTSGMPEQDVQIMNKLIRSGVMTKEEYLAEYKQVQGR